MVEPRTPESAGPGSFNRRPTYFGTFCRASFRHPQTETSRLCALSIVGQILFYAHCRPVLQRLKPEGSRTLELDRLARHITDFSLPPLK